MPVIRQNRLIPILGVVILVAIVGILVKARHPAPSDVPMKRVPQPPAQSADADSPSDTLRTLTAEMRAVRDDNRKLREDNARLMQQTDELNRNRSAIEENVTRRLTERLSNPDAANSPVFAGLNRKIDELSASLQQYTTGNNSSAPAAGSDIPPGLGFDPAPAPASAGVIVGPAGAGAVAPGTESPGSSGLLWVEPLGTKPVTGAEDRHKLAKTAEAVAGSGPLVATVAATPTDDATGAVAPASAGGATAAPNGIPFFTIPENATLMNATAMTALIGRTPVGGNVRDPMEFKVLIGRANLAANGFEVPDDVTGMVMSGVAVGDWMLSCVEGHINSVTFVFEDGSIKTVSKRASGAAAGNGGYTQRLGYISDDRGAPCINGQQVTNAPAYLSQIVGMKSLESAARGAATSQTTTVASGLGATSAVTGNAGQFVLGQAAAAGVDEASSWLSRRLNDSFDAIYVRPGAKVAVHLTESIPIDKDPHARKLDYGRANRGSTTDRTSHAQLD